MGSVGFQPLQLEEVRARLRKMSDAELLRFGRAAASMCSPEANFGHPPRRVFVEQLREAREWRRRQPLGEAMVKDRTSTPSGRQEIDCTQSACDSPSKRYVANHNSQRISKFVARHSVAFGLQVIAIPASGARPMKVKLVVVFVVLFFASLAWADSSATITVDLGTSQLIDTPTQLAIPFNGLNGTLVNGQTQLVTVLFDSGQSIEYLPPYFALNSALAIGTNVTTYPEFASGTGTFLAANGSDLFSPVQLASSDGSDSPNGPGEIAVEIFPPAFSSTGIYGFQFDITYPDTPGVTVTTGQLLLTIQPVPEPSTLLLSAIGLTALIGLGGWLRLRCGFGFRAHGRTIR